MLPNPRFLCRVLKILVYLGTAGLSAVLLQASMESLVTGHTARIIRSVLSYSEGISLPKMAAQLSATARSSLSEIHLVWPEPDLEDNRFSAQVPEGFGKAKAKDQAAPPPWTTAVDGAKKQKENPRTRLVEGAQKEAIKISKEAQRMDTVDVGERDRSKWFERNIMPMVPQKADDVLPFDANLVLDFLGEDFEPRSLDSIASKVEGAPLPGSVESSPVSEEVDSVSVPSPERNAQEPVLLQNVPQLSPACGSSYRRFWLAQISSNSR